MQQAWQISEDDLVLDKNPIGVGAFGSVYSGTLHFSRITSHHASVCFSTHLSTLQNASHTALLSTLQHTSHTPLLSTLQHASHRTFQHILTQACFSTLPAMLQHGDANAIAMLLGIYFFFALMTLSTSTVNASLTRMRSVHGRTQACGTHTVPRSAQLTSAALHPISSAQRCRHVGPPEGCNQGVQDESEGLG